MGYLMMPMFILIDVHLLIKKFAFWMACQLMFRHLISVRPLVVFYTYREIIFYYSMLYRQSDLLNAVKFYNQIYVGINGMLMK